MLFIKKIGPNNLHPIYKRIAKLSLYKWLGSVLLHRNVSEGSGLNEKALF